MCGRVHCPLSTTKLRIYLVFCQFDSFKKICLFCFNFFSWVATELKCFLICLWTFVFCPWELRFQRFCRATFLRYWISTLCSLTSQPTPISTNLLFTKFWDHFPDLISLNLLVIFDDTYHFLLKTLCCLAFWDTTSSCFSTFSFSVSYSPLPDLLWPSPQTPLKVISFTSYIITAYTYYHIYIDNPNSKSLPLCLAPESDIQLMVTLLLGSQVSHILK